MTRTYSASALDLLAALAVERKVTHPLLVAGVGTRTLIVVVASNRGLCGGFNVSLSKAVSRSFAEYGGRESVDFVTIGKNAERLARKLSADVRGSFIEFIETGGLHSIRGLRRLVLDEFLSGRYARVLIAYNKYISAVRYEPIIRPLLPISEIAARSSFGEGVYLFEPDESAVLEEVLPQLVAAQLYQINLESVASEQSARMVAMKNASESAGEMISDLALDWNRARQDGITQEISEIAAGANALAI